MMSVHFGPWGAFPLVEGVDSYQHMEVHKFFFVFLDAFMDMRGEYIALSENITELKRVTSFYKDVGLPGACGSMDVFM